MQKSKADLVIECVRYLPSGQIDSVRLYELRESAYSDREIFSRQQLLLVLSKKKTVYTGKRIAGKAGTFELHLPVILTGSTSNPMINTSTDFIDRDLLQDCPLY